MSFSNVLVLFPLLIFLPCCFLGRVDVIDQPIMPPPQKGTEEQKEIETFVIEETTTKAAKEFQIEEIGRSGQKGTEAKNIFTNGSRVPSCQCPSRKRYIVSVPHVRDIFCHCPPCECVSERVSDKITYTDKYKIRWVLLNPSGFISQTVYSM